MEIEAFFFKLTQDESVDHGLHPGRIFDFGDLRAHWFRERPEITVRRCDLIGAPNLAIAGGSRIHRANQSKGHRHNYREGAMEIAANSVEVISGVIDHD
jgi:hypothetical protein